MTPDPALWMDRNGAICCADHKGSEGWARIRPAGVQVLRREVLTMGLVALHEPLCEACRVIAGKLTREDA